MVDGSESCHQHLRFVDRSVASLNTFLARAAEVLGQAEVEQSIGAKFFFGSSGTLFTCMRRLNAEFGATLSSVSWAQIQAIRAMRSFGPSNFLRSARWIESKGRDIIAQYPQGAALLISCPSSYGPSHHSQKCANSIAFTNTNVKPIGLTTGSEIYLCPRFFQLNIVDDHIAAIERGQFKNALKNIVQGVPPPNQLDFSSASGGA